MLPFIDQTTIRFSRIVDGDRQDLAKSQYVKMELGLVRLT